MKRARIVLAATLALGTPAAVWADCLTDAQIDAYVGARVRAGAATIDTREVPDLPLCSGLTLAQQIQRIHAAAFPEERAQHALVDAGPVANEDDEVAEEPATGPAPRVRLHTVAPVRRKATGPIAAPRRREPVAARSSGAVYGSCRAARAAGAAPIRRGQPGYSGRLDRDGDGIACE